MTRHYRIQVLGFTTINRDLQCEVGSNFALPSVVEVNQNNMVTVILLGKQNKIG